MTISVRAIITVGIRFRSTDPSRVEVTNRLPSTSTRVRVAPRPRRLAIWAPMLKLAKPLVLELRSARNDGSWLRATPTLVMPRSCMLWAPITVTGEGVVNPVRAMCEPVTTTSCTWPESAGAGVVGAGPAESAWAPRHPPARQRPA